MCGSAGWDTPFLFLIVLAKRTHMTIGLQIVIAGLVILAVYIGNKYEHEKRDNERLRDYLKSKGINPDKDIPFRIHHKDVLKELFNKDRY
jgi:hypothetical protein